MSESAARPRTPSQLGEDAPSPGSKESAIRKYITSRRVCFCHARGTTCPRMATEGKCPYSHPDSDISFGAYPLSEQTLAVTVDSDENLLYDASAVMSALAYADEATEDAATDLDPPLEDA